MASWCVLNRVVFCWSYLRTTLSGEQARKTITPEERMQKARPTSLIFGRCWQRRKKLASQAINCCQAAEKGITSISEGSILAVGKARIPHRRKPVASIMMPPQAVKSAIIDGLINAMIKVAAKNRITKTISWGIKITVMIYPSVEAKIAAVKKVEDRLGQQNGRVAGHPFG